MSTHDVPGAVPAHADQLHAGCWAEHADGSLIYVKGTEGDQVVYEIYDMTDPPVSYTDAMPRKAFEKTFSAPPIGASKDTWTWHDKTAFPWTRVMQRTKRPQPGFATVDDQLSAAARVAESLNLRTKRIVRDADVSHQTDDVTARGEAILKRLAAALGQLVR